MALTYDLTTGLHAIQGGSLLSDLDAAFLALAQDISNQRHALQAGVIDSGSYMAVQKAAGANMSVDVGSNSGRGMYVTDTSSRLVFVAPTGSATNVAVTAAHATLPRVDAVVVSSTGVVSVIAGTPTSGATLDNARDGSHGGAAVPSGSQLIADILVGATVTTIPNTVVRDRRPWARGAFFYFERTAGNYTTTSNSLSVIDSTNMKPRIECSGAPLRISFETTAVWSGGTSANGFQVDFQIDGSTGSKDQSASPSTAVTVAFYHEIIYTPAAGSHLFAPMFSLLAGLGSPTLTFAGTSGQQTRLTIEELVRQNTANNSTTTG